MGRIEIDIPKDMERAFEEAFPGDDKSLAVWRVIRQEIERKQAEAMRVRAQSLVDLARQLRESGPAFTAKEIRDAREEGRS